MSRARQARSEWSVKTVRLLQSWGIDPACLNGTDVVPVGPPYDLPDGRTVRLAFRRDDEGRVCVGYAVVSSKPWEMLDARPCSARTIGYFRRKLHRMTRRPCEDAAN